MLEQVADYGGFEIVCRPADHNQSLAKRHGANIRPD
jgi:hypothetical protein